MKIINVFTRDISNRTHRINLHHSALCDTLLIDLQRTMCRSRRHAWNRQHLTQIPWRLECTVEQLVVLDPKDPSSHHIFSGTIVINENCELMPLEQSVHIWESTLQGPITDHFRRGAILRVIARGHHEDETYPIHTCLTFSAPRSHYDDLEILTAELNKCIFGLIKHLPIQSIVTLRRVDPDQHRQHAAFGVSELHCMFMATMLAQMEASSVTVCKSDTTITTMQHLYLCKDNTCYSVQNTISWRPVTPSQHTRRDRNLQWSSIRDLLKLYKSMFRVNVKAKLQARWNMWNHPFYDHVADAISQMTQT